MCLSSVGQSAPPSPPSAPLIVLPSGANVSPANASDQSLLSTTTQRYGPFKLDPEIWLRTMLIFYSLNAKLNHLAGNWPEEFWMTHLPPYVKEKPLTQLSIPGSHDSFAYALDATEEGPLAPDLEPSVRAIANFLTKFMPTVKYLIHNWSKTQQLNFIEQLTAGVRYFDIRVGYHKASKRLRFLHGLWGLHVEDEMSKLPKFLDSHPGEVVILDFNHLYNMDKQDHATLVTMLLSILGKYLIPCHEYSDESSMTLDMSNLTLANLAEMPNQQVIIIYDDKQGVDLSKNVFWPVYTHTSLWPRATDAESMILALERGFRFRLTDKHMMNDTEPISHFHTYQGVLTPDGNSILNNLLGTIYDMCAPKATSAMVKWLTTKRNNAEGLINICIVDAVETFNFLPTVVAMNIF